MNVYVTLRRVRLIFCHGKAINITYSECVCVSVDLVIQHSKHIRRIILSSVVCFPVPYFSTLSHKRHDFRKKLLNIKCVFWFSLKLLSEMFLIIRRIQGDIIIYVLTSSCTGYSCQILMKDEFSQQIFEE